MSSTRRSAGTVVPRGNGRWLLRWFVGKDDQGKRIYESVTIDATNERDARKELRKRIAQKDTNTSVKANQVTLKGFWPRFVQVKRDQNREDSTLLGYEERYLADIEPYFGAVQLKKIEPRHVQEWIGWMKAKGHSARTIQASFGVLRHLLRIAFVQQLVPSIATQGALLPELSKRKPTVLTPEQVVEFLDHQREHNPRWYPLWLLMLNSGVRPQEALPLEWRDYDGRSIRIERVLKKVSKDRWQVFPKAKTEKSHRTILLPKDAIEALNALRKESARISGLIFSTSNGTLLSPRNVARAWKKGLEAAKLPHVRLYDTRHSHATILQAAGVDLKTISERLGHSSIKLTMDTYTHRTEEADAKAAEAFGGALDSRRKEA